MAKKMRKVFNYENLHESSISERLNTFPLSISACGCLFYKTDPLRLMLIKYADPNWPLLDDFGGQIDLDDYSVKCAQFREIMEETNVIIPTELLSSLLYKKSNKIFYNKFSKYYLSLIHVEEDFYPDTAIFGNREIHDNIIRTVNWFPYSDARKKLSKRLILCKELINYLDSL